MRRKVLAASATVAAALAMTVPGLASASSAKHHSLRLAMAGRMLHKVGKHTAVIAGGGGPSVLTHSGFKCEVVVGQGAGDNTGVNHFVTNSTEFTAPLSPGVVSVVTNCIGKLKPGTPHANTVVTHLTANCGQINPSDPSKFISGVGITTTYPNGLFSETCNTPSFTL